MHEQLLIAPSRRILHDARRVLQALTFTGLIAVTGYGQATPAAIVPDGNTQTSLATAGNVTDVTTTTVSGQNAYNSFANFNVGQNTVVNLFLPGGTSNLLNLVNAQAMNVDGTLNSIKDGKFGGNVFFADPYGVFVGKSGVVNAGTFAALTPTKDFMGSMFASPGNPSADATAQLLAGTVPLSVDGLISIQGQVNAIAGIRLAGGSVTNAGTVASGAVFSGTRPDFSDVVNVNGLRSGTHLWVETGDIEIRAAGDFENSGTIASDGADGLPAGKVDVRAGGNLRLDAGSLVSASGHGQASNGGRVSIVGQADGELAAGATVAATGGEISGNGGAIDFSAKGNLAQDGGALRAGATDGTAGTVTLDPTDMTISANQEPNDGSNLSYAADNSITVDPGVTISSRQIGSGTDALNSPSTGNSGNITFTAPQITVGDGDQILANATDGFTPGDITMTATQNADLTVALANAGIAIGNATLAGNNITLSANATATAVDVSGSDINLGLDGFEVSFPNPLPAVGNWADAAATIHVGGAAAGSARLNAAGSVKIDAAANATSTSVFVGLVGGIAGGYSHAKAETIVNPTATITAGGSAELSATTGNSLDVENVTGTSSGPGFAVSIGVGKSESTAEVDGSVTGSDVTVLSKNTNNFSTSARGGDYSSAGESVAVGSGWAFGNYHSTANSTVSGSATATTGDLTVSSASTNSDNETRSNSKVTSQSALEANIPVVGKPINDAIFGESGSLASQSNPSAFGAAPAVSIATSANTATTTVTGKLTATSGAIIATGAAIDTPQISASGSAGGQSTEVGGGVAIGHFSNEADAEVQGSAVVKAGKGVDVHGTATVPNPAVLGWDALKARADFTGIDFSGPATNGAGTGWAQQLWQDIASTFGVGATVVSDVLNPGLLLTSFTNTALTAGDTSTKFGVAGSVDLPTITNQSNAWIAGTAQVTAGTGGVDVHALSDLSSINVAGMAFSASAVIKRNPGVQSDSSLGGSYVGATLNNRSKAYIGDNTVVKSTAGGVNAEAETKTFALNVYQAGDKAAQFGITGAFSKLDVNDSAEAYIQSDATVTAAQDVNVTATNTLQGFDIGGALGFGGTGQVGVTTAWNTVNDQTLAYIGDPGNSRTAADLTPGSGVTATGQVNVQAKSKEDVYAISLAAAKSGASGAGVDGESATQPTGESAPSGEGAAQGTKDAKGGQYGFGVSGNIAFNKFTNDSGGPGVSTQAFINNGANVTSRSGLINVTAQDDSFLVAVGVAGTVGQSFALGGALSWNDFNKDVEAYTTNATLGAAGLDVEATNNGGFYDITAGGGVSTESGVSIAGSVNRNVITNNTKAYLGAGTTANNVGGDGVKVAAKLDNTVVSGAGAVGVGLSAGGVGAAVDVGDYTNNTFADVDSALVGAGGNVSLTASTMENLYPVAFSVAGGTDFGATGSVTWETLNNDTEAYVTGTGAAVNTGGNVLVAAGDTTNRLQIAGDIGGSTNSAGGISADVNHATRQTKAYVGGTAKVNAGGNGTALTDGTDSVTGLRLHASQGGQNQLYAAGGTGAGANGVAGSAVVNVLNDTTLAYLEPGAQINLAPSSPSENQNVELLADDATNLLNLAGVAGIGLGGGGLGAGADVAVITKDTEAYVGHDATVNARDNVKVQATSTEELSSMSGSVGGAASVGIAGAASVYVINNHTKAYVDQNAKVFSEGNVLVGAQDDTNLDSIVGNLAVGGTTGVGASSAVDVITKDTEAWIGQNANVTALGLRSAATADNGAFDLSYDPNLGFGKVPAPHLTVGIDPDPALAKQRVATEQTAGIQGVAVTAAATTSNKTMDVAGGGSASLGASISGVVTVANLTTAAHVDPNAEVNTKNDATAASGQSVRVAAGSDYYHMAMLGGASFTGEGGAVGPAVDVAVATNNTSAYVGTGAEVDAMKDLSVVANGGEDFLSLSAGIGGSAGVGVAGSVSTTTLHDQTYAYLDHDSTAKAGGNVVISANDATKTDSVDGALAVGLEAGGAGGSVPVTTLRKDTQAYVGAGATVDAGGNSAPVALLDGRTASGLAVEANSTEDVFNAAMAGAGGFFGGVAGAVTVEDVHSDTNAAIGDGAKINQDAAGASGSQAVNVLAQNRTGITAYDASSAGAVGGGIAGGVDVGIVDNNTSADIGNNATVAANDGVNVGAASTKNLYDLVASAGVGTVAVPGAVSVLAVDTNLDNTSRAASGGADSYADAQSNPSAITSTLPVGDATTQAQSDAASASAGTPVTDDVSGATITPKGTAAFIGDGATVASGGDIGVNANETLSLSMNDGSVGIGGGSVGAGVGVANIASHTQAYVGPSASLSAAGDILLSSVLDEENLTGLSLSGVLGAITAGGATSIINDTGDTVAYLGANASVPQANRLQINASDTRSLSTTSGQGTIGGAAGGLSLATAKINGSTKAYVDNGALVGQDPGHQVQDVQITASSDDTATASMTAINVGIGLAVSPSNVATADIGTDSGHVLDTEVHIGQGAKIKAADSIGLDAAAQAQASATGTGVTASLGATMGASEADATVMPTVKAFADQNSTLEAGQDIAIGARYNYDALGNPLGGHTVTATAASSAGALSGNIGSSANAISDPTVAATAGDGAALTAGHDVSLLSRSGSNVSATANGNAYGLLSSGTTTANSTVKNSNTALTGTGVTIQSGHDATLSAQSTNVIAGTNATGGQGGLLASGGTAASATLHDTTATTLGSGSQITTPADSGRVLLEAIASNEAHANATDTTIVAIISTNEATATTSANSQVSTTVGANATIQGGDVEIDARGTKFLVDATAHAGANGVDVNSKADSYLEAVSDPKVAIDPGAAISGANSVTIVASLDPANAQGGSNATAKIVGGTGHVSALSDNNLTLNSEIDVASGATLTTPNLDLEALSPHDQGAAYHQTFQASGDTAVNYVTTKVTEVVDQFFGWIPFIGPLIKKVTKVVFHTVAEILGSDVDAEHTGSFASTNAIHMNGTVYQHGGSNARLVVDQNGNIQQASGVDATVGPDQITVNDITNTANPAITLNAPGGLIDGDLTVHRDSAYPSVSIINDSTKDLLINGIQTTASDTAGGINITADTYSGNIDFVADATASGITIQNNSGSTVWFGGVVNEPAYSMTVTNSDGSILGLDGNLIKVNDLSLTANHGSIGGPDNYLNVQLESPDASGAQLSLLAGRSLYMNARLVQDVGSVPAAGYTIPGGANLNSGLVGDDVHLNLGQPQALVGQADGSVSPVGVKGSYNLNNDFSAGGDVNIAVDTGAAINLAGTLSSGFQDISFAVDAGGGVDPAAVNYADSIDATNVSLRDLHTQGGHVSITGLGSIDGTGSIRVLDGYSQLSVTNSADRNLVVGNVDFSAPAAGAISVFGTAQPLSGPLSGTGVTLTSDGHAAGGISLQNSSGGDVLLTGTLANPSGLTEVDAAQGNIISAGSGASIASHDVALNAPEGAIGSPTAYLNVAADGHVDAAAQGDIFLDPTATDLPVGTITSTAGDLSLVATGSILNATGDASRLTANNISLVAQGGSLGASGAALNVVLNGGHVDASAQGDVHLNAVSGDLPVGTITSAAGDLGLAAAGSIVNATGAASRLQADGIGLVATGGSLGSSSANLNVVVNGGPVDAAAQGDIFLDAVSGDLPVGTITSAAGDVHLLADGSIIDPPVAPTDPAMVTGNNITLTSLNGGIGAPGSRLTVDSHGVFNLLAAGDVFTEETAGDLVSDSMVSRNGSLDVLVADGGGSFNQLSAADRITLLVQGGGLEVGQLTAPGGFSAIATTPGASVNLGALTIGGTVTLQGDNISLTNLTNASSSEPLYLDLTGAAGGLANNIDINVSSLAPVAFRRFWTNTGTVDAQTDYLFFDNAIIGSMATFQNNWISTVLDLKTAKLNSSDGLLDTSNLSFYLDFLGDKLQTNGHPDYFIYRTLLDPTTHFDPSQTVDLSSL